MNYWYAAYHMPKEPIIKDTTFFERHTCVPYGKAPAWEVRLFP